MDEFSVCQFDPELVFSPQRDQKAMKETSGTIVPIVTISLLIFLTGILGILWMFRHRIRKYFRNQNDRKTPAAEKQPSLSELELMEITDPFMSRCKNVKTFSVHDDRN